jgi:hypothetical protein
MTENQIIDIWVLFREYVEPKVVELAAERYIDLLVENGVSDKLIKQLVGHDDYLDDAIVYYLEEDEEDDDE